jgi:murein L,D-transpeptidase YcbB/YkuD
MSDASAAVSEQELPPMQMPVTGTSRPLSVAELRWCMSQEIGLQAVQPVLGTRAAFDRQNELAKDFNRRCGARQYSREDSEEATRLVDGAREKIVAAAIEDIQQMNDSALTRRIQEMLELLGYKLEVDGVYGAHTKELIQNFQLKVGIPADGLMSQLLLGRLQIEYLRILNGRE